MRISDWSSDVCSSDLLDLAAAVDGRLDEGGQRDIGDLRTPGGGLLARQLGLQGVDVGEQLDPEPLQLGQLLALLVECPTVQAHQLIKRGQRKGTPRSEEHTSELQSPMRRSYAVFRLNTTTSPTRCQ